MDATTRVDATPSVECTTLLAYLDEQRAHVVGILEGLDEDALRRPVLPSGWSCLAIIQHLQDAEQFWFRCIVAGEEAAIESLADDAWTVAPDVSAETIIGRYRLEIERSNAIILSTPLDAAPVWWPGNLFGEWRLHELRQIVLHVMTETACHAGHLDAVREIIDGRQWLVLT